MRQTYIRAAFIAAASVLFATGGASAEDKMKDGMMKKDGAMSGASGSSMTSAEFGGRHTMEGTVTKIDSAKGTFSLKTADGMMLDLHAPASALQGVKQGDRLAVEIAVKPMGHASMPGTMPSASPRTDMKQGADPLKTGEGTEQPKTGTNAPVPGPGSRPAQTK